MDKKSWFDAKAFYEALDSERRSRALTWKEVAEHAGISASTLTRMAQGKRPDADGLAALCAWSGLPADNFVRSVYFKAKPEPLAMITTYLKSDRNLSTEAADAIDELVKATYERLRKKG